MAPPVEPEGERNPIEERVEEYVARIGRGERLTVEAFAAEHPKEAERILEFFPTVLAMEGFKRDREMRRGGRASLGAKRLERLGDFRILRELGRGGMGVVFEAIQESLDRRVAVKVLPNLHLFDETQLARFEQEARTAAALHHTNIVPIFGTGSQDGYSYYVMQLIRGVGLDDLLRRHREKEGEGLASLAATTQFNPLRGRRPGLEGYWKAVARIGHQVATALAYAHDQDVLHRDIKPGNLILDHHGTAWITDFGLSAPRDREPAEGASGPEGTLAYLAPEQLWGRYDARTDVHGLGLTLYELLTGRAPYPTGDKAELRRQVAASRPLPLHRVESRIPVDLVHIVEKAIAPAPEDRYPDAAALARDLDDHLAGRPISARPISPVEKAVLWCGRNRGMARLAAATVLVGVVALAVGWISYGVTDRALGRERVQRDRARQATQEAEQNLARAETAGRRAESTLKVALEAFRDIFDDLGAAHSPLTPLAAGGEDTSTGPVRHTGPADARLLQNMLAFYDRFARENRDNPRLERDRRRARITMADIHYRLGEYGKALALLEQVRTTKETGVPPGEPEAARRRAVLLNRIGLCHAARGDRGKASQHHWHAVRILGAIPADRSSAECRYEQLISFNHLAGISSTWQPWRQRRQPPGRSRSLRHRRYSPERFFTHPMRIAEELVALDGDNPRYLFARAACQHLLARAWFLSGRREKGVQALDLAITQLENLVAAHPDRDFYRYELGRVYTMAAAPTFTREPETRRDYLDKGAATFRTLGRRYPENPLYPYHLAQVARQRAAQAGEDPARATPHHREALRIANRLVGGWPDNPEYRLLLLREQRWLIDHLRRGGDKAAVNRAVDRTLANIRVLMTSDRLSFIRRVPLLRDYRRLCKEHGRRP